MTTIGSFSKLTRPFAYSYFSPRLSRLNIQYRSKPTRHSVFNPIYRKYADLKPQDMLVSLEGRSKDSLGNYGVVANNYDPSETSFKGPVVDDSNLRITPYSSPALPTILKAGPISRYNVLVASQMVREDPFQRSIVNILQDTYDQLLNYDPPNEVNTVSGKWIFKYFNGRHKNNSPKGLYLYGDVGSGKTMLMDIFYDTLPVKRKRRVHFHAFMLDVHARAHRLKQENYKSYDPIPSIAKDLANDAVVLCFDEFQVTDIADAMILRRLFEELFNHGVVVITTSNRHPDDLYKNGIQRKSFIPCIELIKQKCQIQSLNSGTDYRKFAGETHRAYFYPLNSQTSETMNNIFGMLTRNNRVTKRKLEFLGRSLTVPESCDNIAKFTFKELCCQSLSSADYLELMKYYNTIILTSIPQMNFALRNEARRFITLIDAIYDTKAILICSAETSIHNLFDETSPSHHPTNTIYDHIESNEQHKHSSIFTGEEEKFAFKRAISRLIEMQGEEWLKKVILKIRTGKDYMKPSRIHY